MLRAEFNTYAEFEQWRTDLEDDGYHVVSYCDTRKKSYVLEIERTRLIPDNLTDPGFPFREQTND